MVAQKSHEDETGILWQRPVENWEVGWIWAAGEKRHAWAGRKGRRILSAGAAPGVDGAGGGGVDLRHDRSGVRHRSANMNG